MLSVIFQTLVGMTNSLLTDMLIILATQSLSRFVLDNLKDSLIRPSDSYTVEGLQANIRKTLQIVQPGLVLDSLISCHSLDTNNSSFLKNPFVHRSGRHSNVSRNFAEIDTTAKAERAPTEEEQNWRFATSLPISDPKSIPQLHATSPSIEEKETETAFSQSPSLVSAKKLHDESPARRFSLNKNPFRSLQSRAPTPLPAEMPRRSSPSATHASSPRFHPAQTNDTLFSKVETMIRRATTPKPSSLIAKPAISGSNNSEELQRSLMQSEPTRPTSSIQMTLMDDSEEVVKKNKTPPLSPTRDMLQLSGTFYQADVSSEDVLTPPTSSNASQDSSDAALSTSGSNHEPQSDSEDLYDSNEDDEHDNRSVAGLGHATTTQSYEPLSISTLLPLVRSRPDHGDSRSTSNTNSAKIQDLVSNGNDPGQGFDSRKSPDKGFSEENDGRDDESGSGRQGGSNGEPSGKTDQERFQCPFYVRAPAKHRKWRSCQGPGWASVHRTK